MAGLRGQGRGALTELVKKPKDLLEYVSMMVDRAISPIIKLAGFVKSGETFTYRKR